MNTYDLVIIGAGGSGLAGAMYAIRLGLKVLVLGSTSGTELPIGGVITTTNIVENYPGFIRLTGVELAKKLEEHARAYEADIRNEKVTEIIKQKNLFMVQTNKNAYEAKTLLFATGTKYRKLEVLGSKELENKGVQYCALCDAPLYKNKIVAVIGGSDTAAKDALLLAEHASKVYMIYRGEKISPEPINLARINKNPKIEIINNTNITQVNGEKFVQSVELDRLYNNNQILHLNGIFVAIGHIILSDFAKFLGVKLNKQGEIMINHQTSETSVPGIFAAGDVTDKQFKQLITGVADACTAAHSAYEYLSR